MKEICEGNRVIYVNLRNFSRNLWLMVFEKQFSLEYRHIA